MEQLAKGIGALKVAVHRVTVNRPLDADPRITPGKMAQRVEEGEGVSSHDAHGIAQRHVEVEAGGGDLAGSGLEASQADAEPSNRVGICFS